MTPANIRWALLRAWAERLPFDFADAARLAQCSEVGLRNRAKREGWVVRSGHRGRRPASELERLRGRLWSRIDNATDRPAGEPLDKMEIDAVQILLKALDRLEKVVDAEGSQGAGELGAGESGIAEMLAAINGRVVSLARQMSDDMANTARKGGVADA